MVATLRRLLGVAVAGYYEEMIEEIKSSQPEVEASKSDNRLRRHGHLKMCIISHQFLIYNLYIDFFDIDNKRRIRLLVAMQLPTLKIFDIPERQPAIST